MIKEEIINSKTKKITAKNKDNTIKDSINKENKTKIINGSIKFIGKKIVIVKIDNNTDYKGVLHISDVSDFYVEELSKIFKKNKRYQFYFISKNNKLKTINLSWKKLVPRFLKNPFKFEITNTKKGTKNLFKWFKNLPD